PRCRGVLRDGGGSAAGPRPGPGGRFRVARAAGPPACHVATTYLPYTYHLPPLPPLHRSVRAPALAGAGKVLPDVGEVGGAAGAGGGCCGMGHPIGRAAVHGVDPDCVIRTPPHPLELFRARPPVGVAFLPDGSKCISCGQDGAVRLWPLPR